VYLALLCQGEWETAGWLFHAKTPALAAEVVFRLTGDILPASGDFEKRGEMVF